MKDSISNRIRRIITGSANSIVTKIEGLAPAVILEQAIDEVDDALDEIRAELGKVAAQKHHVTKAITKLNTEHERLQEQMNEAQQQGRVDLLEAAVSRQLDIEDQLPALENQLTDLGGQEKELNAAIAGVMAKRNEMEDELFEFRSNEKSAASAAAEATDGSAGGNGAMEKADKADRAFTRVLQNATGVRRGAMRARSEEGAKLVELAQLNKKARIEARLKALSDSKEG